MSGRSKKNKKRVQGQNLPLKERLAKHWNNQKWEAFVSLYLRDRDAAARTSWASRLGDALYNCMTRALFVDREPENARAAANQLLAEPETALGDDAPLLRACAGIALDFTDMRAGIPAAALRATELPPGVPDLYGKLAHELRSGAKLKNHPAENPIAALTKKMAKQFAALDKVNTLTPYTNLYKTAVELEALFQDNPARATFTAVRVIAELLREVNRSDTRVGHMRSIASLASRNPFTEIEPGQTHPVVAGLWHFFCESGARKFGDEWGMSARTLQIRFWSGLDAFEPAFNKIDEADWDSGVANLAIVATLETDFPWTDAERYILLNSALSNMLTMSDALERLRLNAFIRLYSELSKLGRKYRPERPWTPSAAKFFSDFLGSRGKGIIQALCDAKLPYEAMRPCDIIFFLTHAEKRYLPDILRATEKRRPLRLDDDNAERVALMFIDDEIPPGVLAETMDVVAENSRAPLLSKWLEGMVSFSLNKISLDSDRSETDWNWLTAAHIDILVQHLPADSPEGAFCRMCQGEEKWHLSHDATKQSAFLSTAFSARKDGPASDLFLFVLLWEKTDTAFILSFFDTVFDDFERENYWFSLTDIVNRIQDNATKEEYAGALLKRIRKIPARRRGASLKDAISTLKAIAQGKLVSIEPDIPGEDSAKFASIIQQFFEKQERHTPNAPPRKRAAQPQIGPGKSLFDDFDEDDCF